MLSETSKYIRESLIAKLPDTKNPNNYNHERVDWVDKKLSGKDLKAIDLRRENLSTSMFLTRMQINSAKGDVKTILPSHWIN